MMSRSNLPPVLRPEHPPRRALADLAARFSGQVRGDATGVILTGVTLATGDLRPGEAFVAIQGAIRHGAEFAAQAAEKGAVAVVTDAAGADLAQDAGLPIVVVDDPRGVLGDLSAWVYGTDENLPLLLGTTGTNGKTSITHLLDGILNQVGAVTGLSSTAERHIAGEVIVSRLTTPEASEFHALLALMRERGVEVVAVEVSAQALSRHRVDGVVFDIAAFTNLTHDHLDDYGTMEDYYAAKAPFFTPQHAKRAVISLDSAAGARYAAGATIPVTTVATPAIAADETAKDADWIVTIDDEKPQGTTFTLTDNRLLSLSKHRTLTSTVPVIGPHMASNAGTAIVMMLEAGFEWDLIASSLERDGGIKAFLPGRTQLVSGAEGPAVYVDFGHSPDAFEKTLAAIRRVTPGKVIMLFGADGDRDKTKRADMSRAAVEGSDIVVITDHHPRFENPAEIRQALMDGARAADPDHPLYEFSPPETAIVEAVKLAAPGDAILWAGPGHQDYRDIEGVRTPYSARELARRALRDAGWPVPEPSWPVPYES
ncbi:MAG: UDP-N-acetylmuramoyl-L-alanyl-D-glutamate--2,6-diaminopimelate ligase [Microbacterium sp.]